MLIDNWKHNLNSEKRYMLQVWMFDFHDIAHVYTNESQYIFYEYIVFHLKLKQY